MEGWVAGASGRRRRWLAWALLLAVHVALVAMMLRARVSHDAAREDRAMDATILLRPPPSRATATPLPPPRAVRLRALPHVDADARTIRAPALEPQPVAQAASAPEPPASAASQPLILTLTREQLRAVIAGTRPTLAQSLARPPAPSALSRLAGDDAPYEEAPMPGGVTEVHVHGGCFRMVPTPRSQYDPFNHGGERLTAACTR